MMSEQAQNCFWFVLFVFAFVIAEAGNSLWPSDAYIRQ